MLKVVVEQETLRQGSSGTVHGATYWVMEGQPFPDDSWDDFPVVILGWWLEAATRMARGFSSYEKLIFMDGSPFIELQSLPDTNIEIRRVFEAEVVEDGSDEEFAGFLESESNDGERGGRGRGRGGLEEGDGVSGIGESKIHFVLSLCLMPLFCLSVRVVR